MRTLLTCVALISVSTLYGQTPSKKPRVSDSYATFCQNPHFSQADLNDCVANEAHKEEAKLDITYAHYLKILTEGNRKRLIESQAAWTQYRLAECRFVAGAYDGGSMEPMQYSACWFDLTNRRNKELHNDYSNFE